jgi:hypothetical protein
MGKVQAKYAIIRIPIDPEEKGKSVNLYFTDEDNNTILKDLTDRHEVKGVPLEVNKTVNFIDRATWFSGYSSDPLFCIWWDNVRL